jgi:hypothetical protein
MEERSMLILIPRIVILREIRRTARAFSCPIKARDRSLARGRRRDKHNMIEAEKEGTQKAKKSKQRKGRLYKKQRKKK